MKKSEMIEKLAKSLDLPKTKAAAALDGVVAMWAAELKSAGRVAVSGFGTFTVRARAARKGRNPKTGEAIKIKASKNVAFKAAPVLKAAAAKHKGK